MLQADSGRSTLLDDQAMKLTSVRFARIPCYAWRKRSILKMQPEGGKSKCQL